MKLRIEIPKLWRSDSISKSPGYINYPEFFNWWYQEVEPINKMLSDGVEVYVSGGYKNMYTATTNPEGAEKKALLIDIRPIEPDTPEKVLRDMVDSGHLFFGEFVERAKKVLDAGGGE